MAMAVKDITTRRGIDVTKAALCAFGGAGGQHACLVADALGMSTVALHPFAGVLSAFGMGLAEIRSIREAVVERALDELRGGGGNGEGEDVATLFHQLSEAASAELTTQGVVRDAVDVVRKAQIRYEGTDTALLCDWCDDDVSKVRNE